MEGSIFEPGFLLALKTAVDMHHAIYPSHPPMGVYFEALVEKAFREINKPLVEIKKGGITAPRYDLQFEGRRISLKTETGAGTKPNSINITKLCTTETEPWDAETLKAKVLAHLSRYDLILMLRTIWRPQSLFYQIVDIPVSLLTLIEQCDPLPVGKSGRRRQSLGADVLSGNKTVFHVHFDGSDGKCQIQRLAIEGCEVLREWERMRHV